MAEAAAGRSWSAIGASCDANDCWAAKKCNAQQNAKVCDIHHLLELDVTTCHSITLAFIEHWKTKQLFVHVSHLQRLAWCMAFVSHQLQYRLITDVYGCNYQLTSFWTHHTGRFFLLSEQKRRHVFTRAPNTTFNAFRFQLSYCGIQLKFPEVFPWASEKSKLNNDQAEVWFGLLEKAPRLARVVAPSKCGEHWILFSGSATLVRHIDW